MEFPRILLRTFRFEDDEDYLTELVLIGSERELIELAYREYASRELSAIQRVGDGWVCHAPNNDGFGDGEKLAFKSEFEACLASLISSSTVFDMFTPDEAHAWVERRKALFPAHRGMLGIMPLEAELQRLICGIEGKHDGA